MFQFEFWKAEPPQAGGPWTMKFFQTWALIAIIETIRWTLLIQILSVVKQWLTLNLDTIRSFFVHWGIWTLVYAIVWLIGALDMTKVRSQSPQFDWMSNQALFFALGYYTTIITVIFYLIIRSVVDYFSILMWGEQEEKTKIANLVSSIAVLVTIYAFFAAHLESRQEYVYIYNP